MSSLSKLAYGGLGLAVLLIAIAFLFMNPDQCPAHYTQAQIDASDCVVGANIGLGMMLVFASVIAVVSLILAAVAAHRRRT
jgi:hypothetical protein